MMPDGCFLLEKSGICAICETGYFMRIDKTCTKYWVSKLWLKIFY